MSDSCKHKFIDSNHCLKCGWTPPGALAAPTGWVAVCDDNLPPINAVVWLWDGQRIWIGGRAADCDGWLWGNTYGAVWHNGRHWDGEIETDSDYKPTHWQPPPEPPNTDYTKPKA